MDIVICNEDTGEIQTITVNCNDDLRTLTEAYFGIIPENQVFKYNGNQLVNEIDILDVGVKPGEIISVKKRVIYTENMGLVKDILALDSAITYTLLYLKGECNGMAFRMMIDTGASMSIITENVSKILKVDNLMDTRLKGKAMGVGNSNILGVVCNCNVKLGDDIFVPFNFRVIEDGFDPNLIILGLDFITSHRCIIDPFNRQIEIDGVDGVKLKFLNEMQVQNLKMPYNVTQKKLKDNHNNFLSTVKQQLKSLNLLKKIIGNIVNNPNEEKFKSIIMISILITKLAEDSEIVLTYLRNIGFEAKNNDSNRLVYREYIDTLFRFFEMLGVLAIYLKEVSSTQVAGCHAYECLISDYILYSGNDSKGNKILKIIVNKLGFFIIFFFTNLLMNLIK